MSSVAAADNVGSGGGMAWWRWALLSPVGVAPSRTVDVSASVNLPLHHKVQKFSSGTSSPGWSRKKGHKTVVVVVAATAAVLLLVTVVLMLVDCRWEGVHGLQVAGASSCRR